MFTEFSAWTWIGSAVVFAVGGVAGYLIARQIKDQRTRQLEQALTEARRELGDYRQQVDSHFLKTSLLFNKLTDDYREVYEHLAKGAQNLCGDNLRVTSLKLPQNDMLPGLSAKPASSPTAPSEKRPAQPAGESVAPHKHSKGQTEQVSREEKSLLVKEPVAEEDEVPLGAESTPGLDLNPDPSRSLH